MEKLDEEDKKFMEEFGEVVPDDILSSGDAAGETVGMCALSKISFSHIRD